MGERSISAAMVSITPERLPVTSLFQKRITPVAVCLEGARARSVLIAGLGMLAAVDLDNELVGRNGEVRDVPPDRMLAPDLDRKAPDFDC